MRQPGEATLSPDTSMLRQGEATLPEKRGRAATPVRLEGGKGRQGRQGELLLLAKFSYLKISPYFSHFPNFYN
jgi:hypothetical protein